MRDGKIWHQNPTVQGGHVDRGRYLGRQLPRQGFSSGQRQGKTALNSVTRVHRMPIRTFAYNVHYTYLVILLRRRATAAGAES